MSTPKPRILLLAESCNPEWPSLPIVGYKYARALAKLADVTLVTHVRNRENIEKAGDMGAPVVYIDNEWIARPMYKAARIIRGGDEVAWSASQIMAFLPYVVFERTALRQFRDQLRAGAFDIVHRSTPMSPTLPSYVAGRTKQPVVVGPLNGNLDWPAAFKGEQKREKEGLRKLRALYKLLPYTRTTYTKSQAILSSFSHTTAGLPKSALPRTVSFPEIGFDPEVFHATGRAAPFSGAGPKRFLFAGRLVPYKVPEAAIRAFAGSEAMQGHVLDILGDGPERPRLEAMVAEAGAQDRVIFHGRKTQAEVAQAMRDSDAFVFPSIRELGAGVVIEAMATGTVLMVTNYGAPGDLAGEGRGVRVPLQDMDGLVTGYRAAMERAVAEPAEMAQIAAAGKEWADTHFTWDAKARNTMLVYEALMAGRPVSDITPYGSAQ